MQLKKFFSKKENIYCLYKNNSRILCDEKVQIEVEYINFVKNAFTSSACGGGGCSSSEGDVII